MILPNSNVLAISRTHAHCSPIDIKSLVSEDPEVVSGLIPALERHNKEQLTAVKLPGASKHVRIPCISDETMCALTMHSPSLNIGSK